MKISIYKPLLVTIFWLGSTLYLFAQNPIYLGKSSEVIAAYKAKATTKAQNAPGNTTAKISHAVPGKSALMLYVNGSMKEAGADVYYGSVNQKKGSSFFLKVSGDSLSGNIIIREEKKAYKYKSDANSSVYLEEVDINTVVCIEYGQASSQVSGKTLSADTAASAGPEAILPDLQSLPGATAVVLLDFNGQYVVNPYWNSGNPINAAPASLTEAEQIEVWKLMSEDYRPFNINITTNEAVFFGAPANRRMRVIFTPTTYFYPGAGGVAYIGSFIWGNNTPCWVFNGGIKGAGEAGSHEVGHTLHLGHDGRTNPVEGYFYGQSSWAPIMGVGYYRNVVQWSKGEYAYANNLEDDLAKITTLNGFGYRADDHANNALGATTAIVKDIPGNISAASNPGIISERYDRDVFNFYSNGTTVNLTINPNPDYPNLDIFAYIYNFSGTYIAQAESAGQSASFNLVLPAGWYHLYIDGTTGSLGANSDYGSLGAYSISGYIAPPAGYYIMNSTPVTTCGNYFYDPGYYGNYGNSQNITQTFTPATPGYKMRFNFTSFNLENLYDNLYIYDGPNTSSPVIGSYTGTNTPGIVTATNPTGQLTFRFTSDASVVSSGWFAYISCVNPSPTAEWNKRFGGTATDNFSVVIRTRDGGYLLGGQTQSGVGGDKSQASRGGFDYWVVKVNSAGIRQWDKRFGGTGDDYLNSLVQNPDGTFVLAGNTASGAGADKSQASRGDRDYWIVKISEDGNTKLWDKRFGGTSFDDLRSVIRTLDGGYLLIGHSNSGAGGDKSQASRGGFDYWVVKINSAGTKQWDKRFGGSLDDKAETGVQLAAGTYVLGGASGSGINGDKTQANIGGIDYWVVKISADGNTKLWDKRFGGSSDDYMWNLVLASDGNFVLGGNSNSGVGGHKSEVSRGGYDYWIVKITSDGNTKLWDRRFGNSGTEDMRSLVRTSDGGFLLAGKSDSGAGADKTEASQGGFDYWIVKVNSSGIKHWDKRFGGSGTEDLRSAIQIPGGGYVLGGRSTSGISGDKTEASRGGVDYWIVKTTPAVAFAPLASSETVETEVETESTARVAAEEESAEDADLQIEVAARPNPFSERVNLSFKLAQKNQVSLQVYDITGNLVATLYQGEAEAGEHEYEWKPAQGSKTGLYIARLAAGNKTSTAKLILTK